MPIAFKTRASVASAQSAGPRGRALLAASALLAAALVLLWLDRGFGEYAVTGIFWDEAQGIVTDATRNSVPTVEFSTPDGVAHDFSEDYIYLCRGSRKFCYVRSFQQGEQVPVVYSPSNPARAYIHDWALYGSVLGFFLDLVLAVLMSLFVMVALRRKPLQLTVQLGDDGVE